MGRIGRSYPRFDEAPGPAAEATQARGNSAFQILGAIIGILGALGFIGWLFTR